MRAKTDGEIDLRHARVSRCELRRNRLAFFEQRKWSTGRCLNLSANGVAESPQPGGLANGEFLGEDDEAWQQSEQQSHWVTYFT
jgi:hypothetical protein